VTEQVIYLRGEQPVALAEKIAEMLPDLRKLDNRLPARGEVARSAGGAGPSGI
jgi:hypothetical protein